MTKASAVKSKKILKEEVAVTLTEIFTDIKEAVGDKKFSKKVKKASKVLASGAVLKQIKKEKESPKKVRATKRLTVAKKAAKKDLKTAGKKEKKQANAEKSAHAVIESKATT